MGHDGTARDVLLGTLAIENRLVRPEDVLTAFVEGRGAEVGSLSSTLADRGLVSDEARALLDRMLESRLLSHGGDAAAALSAGAGARRLVDDTEVRDTLTQHPGSDGHV